MVEAGCVHVHQRVGVGGERGEEGDGLLSCGPCRHRYRAVGARAELLLGMAVELTGDGWRHRLRPWSCRRLAFADVIERALHLSFEIGGWSWRSAGVSFRFLPCPRPFCGIG